MPDSNALSDPFSDLIQFITSISTSSDWIRAETDNFEIKQLQTYYAEILLAELLTILLAVD